MRSVAIDTTVSVRSFASCASVSGGRRASARYSGSVPHAKHLRRRRCGSCAVPSSCGVEGGRGRGGGGRIDQIARRRGGRRDRTLFPRRSRRRATRLLHPGEIEELAEVVETRRARRARDQVHRVLAARARAFADEPRHERVGRAHGCATNTSGERDAAVNSQQADDRSKREGRSKSLGARGALTPRHNDARARTSRRAGVSARTRAVAAPRASRASRDRRRARIAGSIHREEGRALGRSDSFFPPAPRSPLKRQPSDRAETRVERWAAPAAARPGSARAGSTSSPNAADARRRTR